MRLLPVLLLVPLALPTTEAAGLVPDPTACWLFDELSGTVAKDACGANDGAYTNGPTLQNEAVFGFSADFDGTNDFVSVPHAASIHPTTAFTIGGWVYPEGYNVGNQIIRKITFAPINGYYLAIIGATQKFQCVVFNADTPLSVFSVTLAVTNAWQHVVCTYSAGTMRLYVNGVLDNTATGVTSVGAGTGALTIGSSEGAGEFFNGRFDRLFVSTTTYTARQVADDYEASEFESASQEQVWLHHSNPSTGAVATTTVKVPRERDKEPIVSAFSTWEISSTLTAPSIAGGGSQTLQFIADGITLTGCSWSITRGTVALGIVVTTESNFLVRCPHPFYVEPGTHTIEVTTAGAALTSATRFDVVLLQETSHLDHGSLYGPVNYDWVDSRTTFRSDQTNDLVNTTSVFQGDQTRDLINTTTASLTSLIIYRTDQTNDLVNITHVHIDAHFNQTWEMIANFEGNATTYFEAILNQNFTCNNCTTEVEPMTMIELPGLTDQQVGAFLLFLVVLIIAFFQRWLFVAIACVIGILDVVLIGGIFGFTFTGLLLVLGIVMQILVDHRDALREARAEKEAEQVG